MVSYGARMSKELDELCGGASARVQDAPTAPPRSFPAALNVDWPSVRMLAMTVGVREAARQLGISAEAVMKRSQREGWLAEPAVRDLNRKIVADRNGALSACVRTPHQVLAETMKDDAIKGRAAALAVSRRALERVNRMDDDELILPDIATMAKTWVQSASIAGGYSATDAVTRVDLRVTASRDDAGAETVHPMEAEWTEATEDKGFTEI